MDVCGIAKVASASHHRAQKTEPNLRLAYILF